MPNHGELLHLLIGSFWKVKMYYFKALLDGEKTTANKKFPNKGKKAISVVLCFLKKN